MHKPPLEHFQVKGERNFGCPIPRIVDTAFKMLAAFQNSEVGHDIKGHVSHMSAGPSDTEHINRVRLSVDHIDPFEARSLNVLLGVPQLAEVRDRVVPVILYLRVGKLSVGPNGM